MSTNPLNESRSYLNRFSIFNSRFSILKGFTLIELLVVIAVIAVLAAGILVLIDPVDKINQANDAKVQNDVSAMGRAAEAYAVLHNGLYPSTLKDLVDAGELKRLLVHPDRASSYKLITSGYCTEGQDCVFPVITGALKSKRFGPADSATGVTGFWRYEFPTGKSCAVAAAVTACPTPTPTSTPIPAR